MSLLNPPKTCVKFQSLSHYTALLSLQSIVFAIIVLSNVEDNKGEEKEAMAVKSLAQSHLTGSWQNWGSASVAYFDICMLCIKASRQHGLLETFSAPGAR